MELRLGFRVEPVQEPVAGVYRLLHLILHSIRSAAKSMLLARRVGDDHTRTVIVLCFADCLDQLIVIRSHSHLCNIDLAVCHEHAAEILLRLLLAGCRELCDRTDRSSLGRLTACVGIDLCIHDQDVDVLAAGDHVIQTAESDIIRPAVAAVHPESLLDQLVLIAKNCLCFFIVQLRESLDQLFAGLGRLLEIIKRRDPLIHRLAGRTVCADTTIFFHSVFLMQTLLIDRQNHAERELRIIFEQGIGPCRSATLLIYSIWDTRHCGAPCLRAAGRICPVNTITVKLCEKLCVRRLAAAGACSRELDERSAELASLDRIRIEDIFLFGQIQRVLPCSGCISGLGSRDHGECFAFSRADICAAAAARAVELAHLHRKVHAFDLLTLCRCCLHAFRHRVLLLLRHKIRADDRMRTDIGATIALDTGLRIPYRYADSDSAFFIGCKTHVHDAVLISCQLAD